MLRLLLAGKSTKDTGRRSHQYANDSVAISFCGPVNTSLNDSSWTTRCLEHCVYCGISLASGVCQEDGRESS
jgi:hypothetical protein